jgi:hypothetical protein
MSDTVTDRITVEYRSVGRQVFSGTLNSLIGALYWRGVRVEGVESELGL